MRRIHLSSPHVGPEERQALLDAFDSNWIAPVGPELGAFEQEVASAVGVQAAAAVSSGTAALHLALLLLGVGAGDEVLVSTLTFAATANAVCYAGARPVFIDCDASWTIDPDLVEEALVEGERRGQLPKALITVDLFGQCCDYRRLREVCGRFKVPIVQDAAEALGSTYGGEPAGRQGALAALSFNGNKIITTSGGGMLLSDRTEWVERARFLATQARDPAPHYEHSTIGYNYRMSNLLAALGRAQLKKLGARVAQRRANFAFYSEHLGDLPGWDFMPEATWGQSNRWLTAAIIDAVRARADREAVRLALAAAEIEARPVWKPLHVQPVFSGTRHYGGGMAEAIFRDGICLPSGSDLTPDELQRIVEIVRSTG